MEYYNVLGVSKDSSDKDIKKAYRKLSLKWHPDKNNNSDESKAKFQEIGEAYGVLSDPEKKQIYDKYGKQGLENAQNGGPRMNPNDIFSQFFGGGGPFAGGPFGGNPFGGAFGHHQAQQHSHIGQDKRIEIGVSIPEMMNGCVKKLNLTRKVFCKKCDGKGVKEGARDSTCRKCHGSGVCSVIRQVGPMRMQQQFPCDVCNGTGQTIRPQDRCPVCGGRKIVSESEIIKITIEKGSKEGEYIQLVEKSDVTENCSKAGDLFLIFKQKPHHSMSRQHDDLIVNKPILLAEALAGLSFVFDHPNGEKIVVEYNDIIRQNSRFKISGKGFYNRSTGKYGDVIFLFDIVFPHNLDNQRKELIKKILPRRKKEDDSNLSCYQLEKTNIDIKPPNMREEYEDINQNECVQQ